MTQENTVKRILRETGRISRNQCLSMFISRLSAIIQNLESDGWVFNPAREKGDYVYHLVNEPPKNAYQKFHDYMQNGKTNQPTT